MDVNHINSVLKSFTNVLPQLGMVNINKKGVCLKNKPRGNYNNWSFRRFKREHNLWNGNRNCKGYSFQNDDGNASR